MNTRSLSRVSLARWLDRIQPSEPFVLGEAGLLGSLAAGAAMWLFKQLIDVAYTVAFDGLGAALGGLGGWTSALVPVAGGLTVGVIAHRFIGEERHHDVAGIMEAVALTSGRLRYRRVPAKAAASALSIGAGASSGRKTRWCRSGPTSARCSAKGCACRTSACAH